MQHPDNPIGSSLDQKILLVRELAKQRESLPDEERQRRDTILAPALPKLHKAERIADERYRVAFQLLRRTQRAALRNLLDFADSVDTSGN